MVMNIWSGFGKLEFHLHLLLLRRQWILLKCRLTVVLICNNQGCTNRCSLAAGLRGNEERMRK